MERALTGGPYPRHGGDLSPGQGLMVRNQVPGHDHADGRGGQLADGDGFGKIDAKSKAHIHFAAFELRFGAQGLADAETQTDLRQGCGDGADDAVELQKGRIGVQADIEGTADSLMETLGYPAQFQASGHDVLSRRQQGLACSGQLHALGLTDKQANSQFLFQIFYLRGQCGLAQMQHPGSLGQVAGLGHCLK